MPPDRTPDGLPLPGAEDLCVYLVGPGFGESQILLAPGGVCIVVDSCVDGSENLTLGLLRRLGVTHVDLLAVTHFDLDHVRGLPDVLREYPPRHVWRPPAASLRELVAFWCRQDPADARLADVHAALEAIDALERKGKANEACFYTRPRALSADCDVWCLAPTACDQRHVRSQLRRLVERANDEPALSRAVRDYLVGERTLGDRPNTLSLALSVRHRERRVLLAGDVENGRAREAASGWKGVIMHLREDGCLGRIQDLDVVKLAHHGSSGAFSSKAFHLHVKADRSTTAVVTPFDRCEPPLPRSEVLKELAAHVHHLGISADARGAFDGALAAGWTRQHVAPLPGLGPHLALVLPGAAPARLYAGSRASFFHR